MFRPISFALCFAAAGVSAFAQAAAPVITPSAEGWQAHAGYPVSAAIAASNSPTVFAATNLPRGLTCDAATGAISGVTAASGEFTVTLQATNAAGTATATQMLIINGPGPIEMPMVTGVTTPAASHYRAGDTLTFGVSVDAPYSGVRVTGQPRIALSFGGVARHATFTRVSDDGPRPILSFSYTVQPGDQAPQGIVLATSIEQNGGTIRDSGGLHCALGLPDVSASGIVVVANAGPAPGGLSLGLAAASTEALAITSLPGVLTPMMIGTGAVVYEALVFTYPANQY